MLLSQLVEEQYALMPPCGGGHRVFNTSFLGRDLAYRAAASRPIGLQVLMQPSSKNRKDIP